MISKQVMVLAGQVMVMAIILSIILLFFGIGTLIFVHVCIVGRALRSGFPRNTAVDERGITATAAAATTTTATATGNITNGNTSLSKDDLEKLPCFDYINATKESTTTTSTSRSDHIHGGNVDCVVCLDSFEVGDKCRLLPGCNHSFHAQCVDEWLLRTPFCPICRATTAEATTRDYCIDEPHQQGHTSTS